MVRQSRHALGETCLEIPGGCVDDTDPDFQTAIARELLEETGYQFSDYHYLGRTSANPSTNNNLMHMFLATGGRKIADQKLDGNEEIQVELYSIEEVKKMLRDNQIVQAMHTTCMLYGFQRLGVIDLG